MIYVNFTRRGIIIHPEEFEEYWIPRLRDARLNVLGIHPAGGKTAHESLEQAIHLHNMPEYKRLRRLAGELGISIEYEMHAMRWLLPASLFSRVPNWFRMDEKGNRTPDFNLCPSNGEALAYLSERAEFLARLLDTEVNRYYMWMDDVIGYGCHCPDCKSLSPSDQQLMVMNTLLSGLRRVNPNALLSYVAYLDAMDVPQSVQPLEGIFLEFAPIRRDSTRPLEDSESPENVREIRSLPGLLDFFGKTNAQVLEYWIDNSRFSNWTKPPKALKLETDVIQKDLSFYANCGFTSVTSFGCFLGEDYRALYGDPPIAQYGRLLSMR